MVALVGRFCCLGLSLPLSPSLVFIPLLGDSYTCSLSWHLTALLVGTLLPYPHPGLKVNASPSTAVDLRSLYINTYLLRLSSWPLLMLLWHTLQGPLSDVHAIHRFSPASRHRLVPGYRSDVQVYTFIS